MADSPQWTSFQHTVNGVLQDAEFSIAHGWITVRDGNGGCKNAPLHGGSPMFVAKLLLGEITFGARLR